MVGVAYRGGIPLEDIEVDFEVEPVERAGSIGFGVRERVTLKGNLSEGERVRLQRASRYCPVGQALTKGSMVIEDEVQWRSGEITALTANHANQPTLEGALPSVKPGTVHASYLLDTKEYDADGAMLHEGEAKVYVVTDNTNPRQPLDAAGRAQLPRTGSTALSHGAGRMGRFPPPPLFPDCCPWPRTTTSGTSRLKWASP